MQAAAKQSQFLRGDVSHAGPGGNTFSDRIEAQGLHISSAAENVASSGSAKQAFDNLWNSPPHRQNILGPSFRTMGVGSQGGSWVQLFGDSGSCILSAPASKASSPKRLRNVVRRASKAASRANQRIARRLIVPTVNSRALAPASTPVPQAVVLAVDAPQATAVTSIPTTTTTSPSETLTSSAPTISPTPVVVLSNETIAKPNFTDMIDSRGTLNDNSEPEPGNLVAKPPMKCRR